jgi:carboxyl-terminal processing protease
MDPIDPDPAVSESSDDDAAGTSAAVQALAPALAPPPPKRRRPLVSIAVALVVLLGGSALFVSGYSLGRQAASDPGTPESQRAAFQPFWDTYHTITDRYAGGDVDKEGLIQGAIRGMIASLNDPYSAYLSADEYRTSLQGISGQFEGIGAQITAKALDGSEGCTPLGVACRLVITQPMAGSPAERTGLKPGDVVTLVDGTSVDGLTVDAARDRIRGPKGSAVHLTIDRGNGPPLVISITRDVVQIQEVESRTVGDGSVGYIRIAGFSDAAADDAVTALSAQLAAGRTKLIVDLRGNPGGFVTAARKIASQFIGSGVLFWQRDATGNEVPTEALPDGVATDPNVKVVVLIDGGSASASEIVAGALQDTGRATLVGQHSYGKGTVQQWLELTGEGGAFKLTVERWLTPDKRWINGHGLDPDVVVTLPAVVPTGSDPVLDKALEVLGGTGSREALQPAA